MARQDVNSAPPTLVVRRTPLPPLGLILPGLLLFLVPAISLTGVGPDRFDDLATQYRATLLMPLAIGGLLMAVGLSGRHLSSENAVIGSHGLKIGPRRYDWTTLARMTRLSEDHHVSLVFELRDNGARPGIALTRSDPTENEIIAAILAHARNAGLDAWEVELGRIWRFDLPAT